MTDNAHPPGSGQEQLGGGPKMRPLLLDLFCGAGGAAVGYHRAGFRVIGVDTNPQPNYPFEFYQADALEVLGYGGQWVSQFQAVHASPPCQRYSAMSACRPGLSAQYPDLIGPTRDLLTGPGWMNTPYVIENVPRAAKWMKSPITLCGQMFGLNLYRHRLFESNTHLWQPEHPKHVITGSKAGHWEPGTIMSISGHVSPIAEAKRAMGIDWMSRNELAESIPPAYTEYIGHQLIAAIEEVEDVSLSS